MRRSARLAKKPKVYYEEEHLWEKAVRKAQKERSVIEKKKKAKRRKKKTRPRASLRHISFDDRDDEKLAEVPIPRRKPRDTRSVASAGSGYMPWEQPDWDPASSKAGEDWNAFLEKPQQRIERIVTASKSKRPTRVFRPVPMTKMQKNLLFMNVGDKPIIEATYAIAGRGRMPAWTTPFVRNLYVKNQTLYFADGRIDLPFALMDEKRVAVKELYFNPKEPSTIQPITDELRSKFCNISRRNVIAVLA